MANEASFSSFSVPETKLMVSILKHLKGNLNSDWDQVAGEMGYKDASIARARWNTIKRKKISTDSTPPPARAGAVDKSAPSHVNTKKQPKKAADGNDAGAKKSSGRKAQSKKEAESKPEPNDDEEQMVKQEEEEEATAA